MFTEKDALSARQDFPALGRQHNDLPVAYLDGPAGTQVPQAVIDAISDYYIHANANTGGQFQTSEASKSKLEGSRQVAADFLGAGSPEEVAFGANMTTLTFSLARALGRQLEAGDEIVITALDHEGNRGPWLSLTQLGIEVREVQLLPDGRLDEEDFAAKVTPRTRLVAMGMASNALGTVSDVALARRLSREVGADLLLDAVHYAAHFPLDVQALDCDYLLCSGYKFYGPHVGVLYARKGRLDGLETDRLMTQGQQAHGRIETGTPNFASICGLAAAIDYIASWGEGADKRRRIVDAMTSIAAYEHQLAKRYHTGLQEISGVTVWGPDMSTERRAPTISITIDGVAPQGAATYLGARAVQLWDGHFYAIRTVESLGLVEAGGLLRTGIAMYNTAEEIDRLLAGVRELAAGAN